MGCLSGECRPVRPGLGSSEVSMRRRDFIGAIITAATLSPIVARAQQSVPMIGILGSSTAADYAPMIATFRKGLSETGYLEGKNVAFEYAWADDHYDRLPALANGLIERRVNVILAAATPSALYQVPEGVTRWGFSACGGSDSRWRTREVRH